MKRTILAVLALIFMTGCGPDDSIEQATEQSLEQLKAAGVQGDLKNDALFAAEAASASMLQVQLGEAAEGMAVSPEVKGLAQEMIRAHQSMLNDLRQMATQSGFVLPTTLGKSHHEVYEEVTSKSGISFDLTYLKNIVEQNEKLVKRYDDIAEYAQIMELKQYASKQLPLLRQHQEILEELEDSIDDL
ncbi:DUF4142 domain-containing protein [Pontibacter oryzae]|uniref:DUF4142 domain-containing protein n=1 Tax=Pontibacter oryzae TaxID=2304593 RepID=A0A399S396_9BACT|nr:DUF4142 domain-containing protein [Pontibacter oryzae]RIJ37788.1 DUF4142 domain-containing protein [Pontibacter oryzae]